MCGWYLQAFLEHSELGSLCMVAYQPVLPSWRYKSMDFFPLPTIYLYDESRGSDPTTFYIWCSLRPYIDILSGYRLYYCRGELLGFLEIGYVHFKFNVRCWLISSLRHCGCEVLSVLCVKTLLALYFKKGASFAWIVMYINLVDLVIRVDSANMSHSISGKQICWIYEDLFSPFIMVDV